MKKSLKIFAAAGCICVMGLTAFSGAAAQNASNRFPGGSPDLIHKISAQQISELMAEYEIETALMPYSGGDDARLIAKTPGGAQFVFLMRQCENVELAADCAQIVISTAFSNSGLSYDDLNAFNGYAAVTKAINLAEQEVVVFGLQVFLQGGRGSENFKYVTELFLLDMQRYVTEQREETTQVSLNSRPRPSPIGKIANTGSGDGANPLMLNVNQALSTAIANTARVQFWNGPAR